MSDLQGKIALVTGGAAGIGFGVVKDLLKNHVKGVTIVDVDEGNGKEALKSIEQEFGPLKAIFVKTDVTKADQFEDSFKTTIKHWGTLDILVNNAGIFKDAAWEFEISINSTSVVRGNLLGLQYMRKDRGGKGGIILNMASILGLAAHPLAPVYTATKHFVIGLTRSLGSSYYLEQTGVKVLAICPGVTDTMLCTNTPQNALEDLLPRIGERLIETLNMLPHQSPEVVGVAMVKMIQKAENGSIWVVEGGKIYDVEYPSRFDMKKSDIA